MDDERLDLRDLPPVDPVPRPATASQTLLAHHNRCPRSAYLYLKYHGGTPAHELDRGTAAHAVFERMLWHLIEHGESDFISLAEGESLDAVVGEVATISEGFVDEVLRERPDLVVPEQEREALRIMAYHFAIGLPLDPGKVVGIEQKMALQIGDWLVTGKIDISGIDGLDGFVWDLKTQLAKTDQEVFEESFQTKLYALLLAKGRPVISSGAIDTDPPDRLRPDQEFVLVGGVRDAQGVMLGANRWYVLGEPLGLHLQQFRVAEVYPRFLDRRGEKMVEVFRWLSRIELERFERGVAMDLEHLEQRLESWKFPAVPGSHCSRCPCAPECPLPGHLRRYAGAINSMEQAREAAEWVKVMGDRVGATKKELRAFADAHGPIRFGKDRVLEFSTEYAYNTDWPKLEEMVVRSVEFGEPFELAQVRKERTSRKFVDRRLALAEQEEENPDGELSDLDIRFGAEPPF